MAEAAKIRVFTVDDHPLLHQGLAVVIREEPDMTLVGQASSGRDAIKFYRDWMPDVTVMDLRLPDLSGIDAMVAIRSEFPEARVIILSTFAGDVEIQRALQAGAYAYMLKSMPTTELMDVIRQVHSGKRKIPTEIAARLAEHYSQEALTQREVEVLQQVAGGNRNRDIADKLHISEDTVKFHIKHIMEKLGATDRTQAVAIGVRRGIIHL
jgi:DNA-binding NarL/FixJ family response regulator